jgi:dihydrofolate reductase
VELPRLRLDSHAIVEVPQLAPGERSKLPSKFFGGVGSPRRFKIPLGKSVMLWKAVTLARLIYSVISSLDGYFEDTKGKFDWAEPDEEVHAFANDLDRSIGTYLYGRRMYETMVFWETVSTETEVPTVYREFASIWRAAEKIVYSRTLETPFSARTRIEREFEPDAVRQLKLSLIGDIAIAGGELAGQAMKAGLVDDCHLFVCPVLVGGGKPAFSDDVRANLELLEEHRFENGVVHLHYSIPTAD